MLDTSTVDAMEQDSRYPSRPFPSRFRPHSSRARRSPRASRLLRRRRARSTARPRRPRTTGRAVRNTRLPVRVRRGTALGSPRRFGLHPREGTRWRRGLAQTRRRPPTSARSGTGRLTRDCHILGSLLQLRGSTPSASPLVDVRGNVLAFSGKIFGGVAGAASGAENDAAALLAAFDEVFARAPDDEGLAASALVARLRGRGLWRTGTRRPTQMPVVRARRLRPARTSARLLARPRRRRATRRLASRDGTRPVVRRAGNPKPRAQTNGRSSSPGCTAWTRARRARRKRNRLVRPGEKKKKARRARRRRAGSAGARASPGGRARVVRGRVRARRDGGQRHGGERRKKKHRARRRGGWTFVAALAAAVERRRRAERRRAPRVS